MHFRPHYPVPKLCILNSNGERGEARGDPPLGQVHTRKHPYYNLNRDLFSSCRTTVAPDVTRYPDRFNSLTALERFYPGVPLRNELIVSDLSEIHCLNLRGLTLRNMNSLVWIGKNSSGWNSLMCSEVQWKGSTRSVTMIGMPRLSRSRI